MRVKVVDRQAMADRYGTPSFNGVVLRTVEILDVCPVCGKQRATPSKSRYHEWGEFYEVDTWMNACGHVDSYTDVLREADMIREGLI